jgi:hypothetical protein
MRNLLGIIYIVLGSAFLLKPVTALGQGSTCSTIFTAQKGLDFQRRAIIAPPQGYIPYSYWMQELRTSGDVIFSGKHGWVPGSDFLSSNEGDWYNTPFDNKPTDLMIAFGTNSFWEIAVNKKAKNVILGDWSPLPLLAHAFVISPLIRISATPVDFIRYLDGQAPNGTPGDIKQTLYRANMSPELIISQQRVQTLLEDLAAKSEISDVELYFLSQYFWSRTSDQALSASPFRGVRSASFMHLAGFLGYRYAEASEDQLKKSVLHNPFLFTELKKIFTEKRIKYAWTEIANPEFYRKVKATYPDAKDWTVSATNIFDMNYNNHNYETFKRYLESLISIAGITEIKPLTVFRTTSGAPPHGFYRYDVKNVSDIPALDQSLLRKAQ